MILWYARGHESLLRTFPRCKEFMKQRGTAPTFPRTINHVARTRSDVPTLTLYVSGATCTHCFRCLTLAVPFLNNPTWSH